MDPEQRLLVIHEYLTVKFLIFLFGAVIGMFGPQGMGIAQGNRAFIDLHAVSGRRYFHNFLVAVFILFFFCFSVLMNVFYHHIILAQLSFINGLIFLRGICFGEKDLCGHERTIFFQHLTHAVLIGKFKTVFIQVQGNFCTDGIFCALADGVFRTAVTFPVYRGCAILVGERINFYIVSHHKYGIEAKSEMTDDLILIGLILIFLQKSGSAGESDLCNILLDFSLRHTKSGINKFQCFFFGINDHLDAVFVIIRVGIFSHNLQLVQLCDGIAAVGHNFPGKDVVVRIEPFFDNWENIFTVNGKISCLAHNITLLICTFLIVFV